jgi:hypothetical protein
MASCDIFRRALSTYSSKTCADLVEHAVNSDEVTVHPYGFVIFRIGPIFDRCALRIHVWLRNFITYQHPIWAAHNHPGDLHSRILLGRLQNTFWDVDIGCGSERRIYEVKYLAGRSLLCATDIAATARPREKSLHEAGDTYSVLSEQFHTSKSSGGSDTVTLAVMEQRQNILPKVVGKRWGQSEYRFDRGRLPEWARQQAAGSATKALREYD